MQSMIRVTTRQTGRQTVRQIDRKVRVREIINREVEESGC